MKTCNAKVEDLDLKNMGVDKGITGNVISKPLMSPLTSTPEEGAKTPLFLTLDPSVDSSGKLYSSCKEIEVDEVARDEDVAKKLMAIDAYWSGLKTKSEILHK